LSEAFLIRASKPTGETRAIPSGTFTGSSIFNNSMPMPSVQSSASKFRTSDS
jgi:hypothetical protein